MKRHLVILAALALLAIPLMVRAEDGGNESAIPPEMHWTPYPPAGKTVDSEMVQLLDLLVKQGVITPQDQSRLTQPQSATPAGVADEMTVEPDASYRNSR